MSSSREDSPDWLRSFQAPTVTLSSDSDPLTNNSPSRDDKIDSQSLESDSNDDVVLGDSGKICKASGKGKTSVEVPSKKMNTKTKKKKDIIQADRSDGQVYEEATSEKHVEIDTSNSVWTLSSDSESFPDNSLKPEPKIGLVKRSGKNKVVVLGGSRKGYPSKTLKEKSPNKLLKDDGYALKKENSKNDDLQETGNHVEFEVADEETIEKHTHGASSRIPLVLSEKVNRSKALVECDGESIDLSGDVGAVGRVVVPNASSGNHEMFFDLKGTIYRTTIIPSRTFCIVSFGQSEAKERLRVFLLTQKMRMRRSLKMVLNKLTKTEKMRKIPTEKLNVKLRNHQQRRKKRVKVVESLSQQREQQRKLKSPRKPEPRNESRILFPPLYFDRYMRFYES